MNEHRGDEHEHRGENAAGPAGVEAADVDAPRLLALLEEQASDEEAGEDEEVVDADPATDERRHAEVVGDDEDDEQAAVTVERRIARRRAHALAVASLCARAARHGRPPALLRTCGASQPQIIGVASGEK